jgi:hypothetical protein
MSSLFFVDFTEGEEGGKWDGIAVTFFSGIGGRFPPCLFNTKADGPELVVPTGRIS